MFTVEIFVNGQSRAQCKIWQGVMHSREGISYSEGSFMLNQNACNEVLTVCGELALQAMMNMDVGGSIAPTTLPEWSRRQRRHG